MLVVLGNGTYYCMYVCNSSRVNKLFNDLLVCSLNMYLFYNAVDCNFLVGSSLQQIWIIVVDRDFVRLNFCYCGLEIFPIFATIFTVSLLLVAA